MTGYFKTMLLELFGKYGLGDGTDYGRLIQNRFRNHLKEHLAGWEVYFLDSSGTGHNPRVLDVKDPQGIMWKLSNIESVAGLPQPLKRAIRKFERTFWHLHTFCR